MLEYILRTIDDLSRSKLKNKGSSCSKIYFYILYDAIIVFYTGTIKNLVTYGVLLFEGVTLSVKKSLVFRRNSD